MKLLVLDGNSILNRAFYGVKGLANKKGFFTNGIYGFLTMFNKIKEETLPDAVAIAFDLKKPTFRHEAFEGYKAKRKGMPDDLAKQLPVLKELLKYLGYTILECEGFEADDILGTLAKKCRQSGNECIIATGDRDSLQLVNEKVSVRIASTKFGKPEVTLFDTEKILEDYKVNPQQLIDIKAIQGDTSDNIPGVPGIGQKGASELIQKFGSLSYIYDNIDAIDIKEGMRKKLKDGKESAYMSRMLGTIRDDVPINTNITDFIPKNIDKDNALNLMTELEMFSLIDKMNLKSELTQPDSLNKNIKYEIQNDNVDLKKLYNKLKENKKVIFLCEIEKSILSVNIIIDNTIYLIKDCHKSFESFLKDLFQNKNIKKQTYNIKPIISAANQMNITLENIDFDAMLASYLINPSSSDYSLSYLSNVYNLSTPNFEDEKNQMILSNLIILNDIINILKKEIKDNLQEDLLNKIEIPLARVLSNMENIGFKVSANGIKEYSKILEMKILALESQIYSYV